MDAAPDVIRSATTLQRDTRGAVEALQAELVKLPQHEPPTTHRFHGGMYCRELVQEKGVLLVGRVHRMEHFFVLAGGTVLITTDEGAKRLSAPAVLESKVGTKRAIYAETTATYMTFHRTEATTVEAAEAEMVEQDDACQFDCFNKLKHPQIEVEK